MQRAAPTAPLFVNSRIHYFLLNAYKVFRVRGRRNTFKCLVCYVWKESHKPCPLDSVCKCSLVLGSESCLTTVKNTCVWVHELRKDFCILVVDELDVVLVKVILFFHNDKLLGVNS